MAAKKAKKGAKRPKPASRAKAKATAKPKAKPQAAAKAKPQATAKAKAKAKPQATAKAKAKAKPARAAPSSPGELETPEQALSVYQVIRARHPDAHCELEHQNPFQLLVATVLSAQSTDVMVNKITPELFRRWPTPQALAQADPPEVEQALSRIGMFRQKTKSIVGLSKLLVEKHQAEVPRTLAELITLPGVGRKTANVVLGVAFDMPEGVVVDTHVQRLSQRLGLTRHTEPVEIEQDLMRLFDRTLWDPLSHTLIFHGRRICTARKPACGACPANELCPSAFNAELVGRK
jgi:endonuclease-3